MVWEASDEGVFSLLGRDVQVELEVAVDVAEKVLDLSFVDEDEGFRVVVEVPEVVAAVVSRIGRWGEEVRVRVRWVVSRVGRWGGQVRVVSRGCENATSDLQVPLTCPELGLVEKGRGDRLGEILVAPLVRVLGQSYYWGIVVCS